MSIICREYQDAQKAIPAFSECIVRCRYPESYCQFRFYYWRYYILSKGGEALLCTLWVIVPLYNVVLGTPKYPLICSFKRYQGRGGGKPIHSNSYIESSGLVNKKRVQTAKLTAEGDLSHEQEECHHSFPELYPHDPPKRSGFNQSGESYAPLLRLRAEAQRSGEGVTSCGARTASCRRFAWHSLLEQQGLTQRLVGMHLTSPSKVPGKEWRGGSPPWP